MKRLQHRKTHIPRVLAVVATQGNCGTAILRGIFTHIAEHGEWGLEIVRSAAAFTAETIKTALSHKVDGVIVALNEDCPKAYRALVASGLPFVTIETYSSVLCAPAAPARHFRIDNAGVGRDAARSFLRQGRYMSFGFVPPAAEREWARLRGEGFTRELTQRNRAVLAFPCDRTQEAIARRGDLAKWLRRMEKPAAVLAADDTVALEILQACQSAKLKVPDEIAILGVDNEPMFCENVKPALSSIRPAFMAAGQAAAEELERMMRGTGRAKAGAVSVVSGRNEIVTRASTRPETSSGLLVQEAISFIQANARHGICVEDVRAHLGVSRALMDLRFREVRGESVLTVLTAARLKELKNALMSSGEPVAEITARLGWSSPNYPKRLFKQKFGCSMLAWRQQHGAG